MKNDCEDKSDEHKCTTVVIPGFYFSTKSEDDWNLGFFLFLVDDYDKDSPPRIIGSVPVHFQLTVTSIDEIDVMNQKIR